MSLNCFPMNVSSCYLPDRRIPDDRQGGGMDNLPLLDTFGDSPPRAASCECSPQLSVGVAYRQQSRSARCHKQMNRSKQPNVHRLPAEAPESMQGVGGGSIYLSVLALSHATCTTVCSS